jgi:hypothetical protein
MLHISMYAVGNGIQNAKTDTSNWQKAVGAVSKC